jgi:hypothetical protein
VHQDGQQNCAKISHNFYKISTLTQYSQAGCPGTPPPADSLFEWRPTPVTGRAAAAKPLKPGSLHGSNPHQWAAGKNQSYRIPGGVTAQKSPLPHGRHVWIRIRQIKGLTGLEVGMRDWWMRKREKEKMETDEKKKETGVMPGLL